MGHEAHRLLRAWASSNRSNGSACREGGCSAADLMVELHRASPPQGLRTVEDLGRGFARVRPAALVVGADAALIDRAEQVYQELCRSQAPRVLAHGDLHHDNILFDEAGGWLAIDPKGVLGETAYETGALLRNPGGDPALYAEPGIISRRAAILGEQLGLPRERIFGWCFAQAVLSALWFVEDGWDPTRAWRMAEASATLV